MRNRPAPSTVNRVSTSCGAQSRGGGEPAGKRLRCLYDGEGFRREGEFADARPGVLGTVAPGAFEGARGAARGGEGLVPGGGRGPDGRGAPALPARGAADRDSGRPGNAHRADPGTLPLRGVAQGPCAGAAPSGGGPGAGGVGGRGG